MTGARASSREQNPAYRACTYGDAAFRSIPFFVSPAQAAKAADEKTGGGAKTEGSCGKNGGGPGNPGSKRTDGAGTTGNRRASCAGAANWQRRIAGRLQADCGQTAQEQRENRRADCTRTAGKPAGRLRTNGGRPGGTPCPPVFRSGRHPVRGQAAGWHFF